MAAQVTCTLSRISILQQHSPIKAKGHAMTTFVSTAIPYVNARPHVGFALELVQADAIARYHRLKGNDVYFLTGTDENALKNVLVAQQQGISPRELCDANAATYQVLVSALNISADRFIRTSEPAHHQSATQLWKACRKGDIYLKQYRGLYCIACEDFLLERDLVEGHCPEHHIPPEPVEEQNYFFRLSAYQQTLDDLIASDALRIRPQSRRNEALSFIRQGLHDFSISRPAHRAPGWGIPVPGDPTQTLYVWFDALANYLTGPGYGTNQTQFDRYWQHSTNKIHVIGKNVLKFHAIYWPALLLSAGLPLPSELVVHGFLTVNGQKIGKSLGNAIDPQPIIECYGADAVRYYLLRHIPFGADGDFSETRLRDIYISDLANGLGNLVHRLSALCERAGYAHTNASNTTFAEDIAHLTETFQFHFALQTLWERIGNLNRAIEIARPWACGQTALHCHLATWIAELYVIARTLSPFLPQTSAIIEATFFNNPIRRGNLLFPKLT